MELTIKRAYASYPKEISTQLLTIRDLIFIVSRENHLGEIEETLKWGEPAYLVKGGSTIRLGWKNKTPDQYGIYFNCQSKLIPTFKELYVDVFAYEGNRAILFQKNERIPIPELKHCLFLALHYHHLKRFPLLGVGC